MHPISQEFIQQCISVIEEKNKPKILKCFDQLTDEQIWSRPNGVSNSVGNLILHLCGNIRQYVISGLGDAPDIRERDLEFSTTGGFTRAALLEKLDQTLGEAFAVMRSASDERLLRMHTVQGFRYSGIGIIVHITEHFSHHTGQIIFWAKQLTSRDMAFYAGHNLNTRNK